MHRRLLASWTIGLTLAGLGCGSSSDADKRGTSGSGGAATGSGAAPGTGATTGTGATSGANSGIGGGTNAGGAAGGVTIDGGGTGATIGGGGSGGTVLLGLGGSTGTPRGEDVCDGIDNDNNGIIDDVDLGGDGVCDCLNIATIGSMGKWGQGDVFDAWLNSRGPKPATKLGGAVLTPDLIRGFNVIVVLNVYNAHAYSTDEAAAIEGWTRTGGGLMTTTGYTTRDCVSENVNVNRLLAFSGSSYGAPRTDGDITNWAPHPVTASMGTSRIENGCEPHGGLIIGWDPLNEAALNVIELDAGHIALWGDEWITYDALWNNVAQLNIELLWLNLLKWLSPTDRCQVPIPTIY